MHLVGAHNYNMLNNDQLIEMKEAVTNGTVYRLGKMKNKNLIIICLSYWGNR